MIPAMGLGTWRSKHEEVRAAVKAALLAGYRHIDTAFGYGNEYEVGLAIKESGIRREEIWVTTKLDNTWHHRAVEGLDASLKSLGLEYVDLYLMVCLSSEHRFSAKLKSILLAPRILTTRSSPYRTGILFKPGE